MKRKILLFLTGALAVAAIGLGADALRSRAAVNSMIDQHLLEAQEHMSAMAVKLSKAPLLFGSEACVELLSGVSRQADHVVSQLSALPVSHLSMADAVKFCNQVSEYTLMLCLKAARGEPLSEEELSILRRIEAQCTLLSGQLATHEPIAMPMDSVFLDDADHGMDYPAMVYDGAFSDARHRGAPKALGEGEITQDQAIALAVDFVGEERVKAAAAGVPTGGAIACYGVTLTLKDGVVLNADVTQTGGKMLWIMPEHASFSDGLTLEECTEKAEAFLQSRGYGAMEAQDHQVYDHLAVISFVCVQDGVLLYPDQVKVQLRMDTGEVVGLESNNYLMNHVRREGLAPLVSEASARASLSPAFEIRQFRLCLIPERDEEYLCWEARGEYGGREYRVYIDAMTGLERQVYQVVDGANGQMAV